MEKTKEQKLASKQRYLAQEAKAIEMLRADNLYDFIDGLKYSYSLSIRYKSANLRALVIDASYNGVENIYPAFTNFQKCLKCGILKNWQNTYWFDKEKAESLQQYILEHNN